MYTPSPPEAHTISFQHNYPCKARVTTSSIDCQKIFSIDPHFTKTVVENSLSDINVFYTYFPFGMRAAGIPKLHTLVCVDIVKRI